MAHYFSKNQDSELKITEIDTLVRGFKVKLKLGSGTFSAKKLDAGSLLLAKKMEIRENDNVLDMGCGTGIIGIIAAKLTTGNVTLTDINERACKLAQENSKGIKNIIVLCGDAYEPVKDMKFDVVLLNPPQTAGKELCLKIIKEAKWHLNKNSSLQMVARHNKGGETLSKCMESVFGNVSDIAKKSGYRVYKSVLE